MARTIDGEPASEVLREMRAASGAARNPSSLSAHSSWLTKILPGQGVAAAGTRIGSCGRGGRGPDDEQQRGEKQSQAL